MASSDYPEHSERETHKHHKEEDEDGEKESFMEKVEDFVHDIGEKLEEVVQIAKPTADVVGFHIPHISAEKAELVLDVLIKNPCPVPIPLVNIQYLVESEGRNLVSGLIPDAGTISPHGTETVQFPMVIVYDDIKSTFEDIRPGSIIPYLIRVALIIDVPIVGRHAFPLEKSGEFPVPYTPDVDVEKIKFDKFSFEETNATLHLNLDNKNDFDLGLNALKYEMSLSDMNVASAELADTTKIDKQKVTNMRIPFCFKPKEVGHALWEIMSGKGSGYTFKGHIDVDTPFGNMKLPISKEGGTTRFHKGGDDEDEE